MVRGNTAVITVFYINKCNENLELYGVWKHGCNYCVLHKINEMKILSCMVCGNMVVITVFYINKCNEELYGMWKHSNCYNYSVSH